MDDFDFMNETDDNFNPVENRLQIRESDKEIGRNRFRRKNILKDEKSDVLVDESPTKKDVLVDESRKKRDVLSPKKDVLVDESPKKSDVLPIVKKESDKEKKQKAYVEAMKKKALEEKQKRKQFEKKQKQTILATDKKEKEQVKQYEYRVKQKEKKEHKEQKEKAEAKEKADLKKKKDKAKEEKKERDKIKEDLKVETKQEKEKRHKEEAKYIKQKKELEESIISKIGILKYNTGSSYMDSVLTALFVVAIEEFEACLNKPSQFIGAKQELREVKEEKTDDEDDVPIEIKEEKKEKEEKEEKEEPGFFQRIFGSEKEKQLPPPKKLIQSSDSDDSNELRQIEDLDQVNLDEIKNNIKIRISNDLEGKQIPTHIQKLIKKLFNNLDLIKNEESYDLFQQCIIDLDNIYKLVEKEIEKEDEKEDENKDDIDISEDIVEQKKEKKERQKDDKNGYGIVSEPKPEGFFDRLRGFFKDPELDPDNKYTDQIKNNVITCIIDSDNIIRNINIEMNENTLENYLKDFKKCGKFVIKLIEETKDPKILKRLEDLKNKLKHNVNIVEYYKAFVPIHNKYKEHFTGNLNEDSDIDPNELRSFIDDCNILLSIDLVKDLQNKLNDYIKYAKKILSNKQKLQDAIPSKKSCYEEIVKKYSSIKKNLTVNIVNDLIKNLQSCDEPNNKEKIEKLMKELEDKQEELLKHDAEEKYPDNDDLKNTTEQEEYLGNDDLKNTTEQEEYPELDLDTTKQEEYNPFDKGLEQELKEIEPELEPEQEQELKKMEQQIDIDLIQDKIKELEDLQKGFHKLHAEQRKNNNKTATKTYEKWEKVTKKIKKLKEKLKEKLEEKLKKSQMSFTTSYCMLTTREAIANILRNSDRTITTDAEKDRFLTEYFRDLQIEFIQGVKTELKNIQIFVRPQNYPSKNSKDVSQLRNYFKSCNKYIQFGDVIDKSFKDKEKERKEEQKRENEEELKKQQEEEKEFKKQSRKKRGVKFKEKEEKEEKELEELKQKEAKEKLEKRRKKEGEFYKEKSFLSERNPIDFLNAIFDIVDFRINNKIPIIEAQKEPLSTYRIDEDQKNFIIYSSMYAHNLEYIINDCELYCMVVYNGSNFTCSYRPLRITKCVYVDCKNPAQYGRNKESRCEVHKKKDDSKLEELTWYSINDKFKTIEKIENINASNTQLFFYRKMQPQTKEKQKETNIMIKTPAPYRFRNRLFGMQNDDDDMFKWN